MKKADSPSVPAVSGVRSLARTEWEAADRHFQGLPIGREDAKAVRSLILRRSLLLRGGGDGPLAYMVNGIRPARLIAKMLHIPFSDPDFTAPDLPVATLTQQQSGHSGYVMCVAVLADGRFVTGSWDSTVKVWKESSRGVWSVEATLTGHGSWVSCAAVLADGRFVTGSNDYTVKVWKESSPGSGQWSVEATLAGHSGYMNCVAVLADGRFVTGIDDTVKVWKESSPGSGQWSVEATLTGHGRSVLCVAVLADGRFVTGSDDATVKVWKESSPGSGAWSVEATLTGHSYSVMCVAVLADGRFVTGSEDKTVKVWKESSPGSGVWSIEATLTHQRSGHSGWVICVAVLSPLPFGPVESYGVEDADGRFVTGSEDKTVKVWKESSPGSGVWSVQATLTGHGHHVCCVAVLPPLPFGPVESYGVEDADEPTSNRAKQVRIVTGSDDKTVKVWG